MLISDRSGGKNCEMCGLGGGLLLLGADAWAACAADDKSPANEGPAAPTNGSLKTIRGLRTIHGNFLDKPIAEPTLQTILQSSVRAANASNMQSFSIVVVKDRKTMGDVCGYRAVAWHRLPHHQRHSSR
jgi:hypothetical protein